MTIPKPRDLYARLKYILLHSEGALLEFVMCVVSILWGGWLILPFDAFSTTAFRVMGQIAPEDVWGGIVLFIGLAKMFSLLAQKKRAKKYLFFASIFIWSCVAISFIAASPTAPGTPIYSLITVLNAFCVWRGVE